MIVYIIALMITLIGGLLAQKFDLIATSDEGIVTIQTRKHSGTTRIVFIFMTVSLILISGLRFGGGDYFTYYHIYEYYANTFSESLKSLDEPGMRFICWVLVKFTKDPVALFLTSAIITIGLSMRVIYKQTDRLLMASLLFLFLGCWHESFNAVRQCLAAAIIFCGFNYLKDKKFIKYSVIVFIAFLFHRSALIMILPFFIVRNKISRRNIFLIIVGSIIILYSYGFIYGMTETLLDKDLSLDLNYINKGVNLFRIAVAIVPTVYFLLGFKQDESDTLSSFYMNLLLIHSSIMLMSSGSAYFARMGIYSAPFCCIAIPELSKRKKQNNNSIWEFVIMLLFLIYWIYDISAFNFGSVTFDFIWHR